MKLGLRYDMRAPAFGAPPEALYRAALEQAAWADARGFHSVSLSEHHGAEDGYLPSPLVLGGAMAAVTKNVRIQFIVLVVTLHDPLRVAEDVAVLDLISGGRVELHLGSGYRAEEFAMFGKELGQRAATMDAILPLLEQAWSGEPFDYHGIEVVVTPRPLQRPRPPVFLGGQTFAAARRAARLGDGFMPISPDPAVGEEYVAERERLGLPPGRLIKGSGALFLHVAEDPDAAWAKIAPHALHDSSSYLSWSHQGPKNPYSVLESADGLRASGVYRTVTPDECLEMALAKGPDEQMIFHPLMAGSILLSRGRASSSSRRRCCPASKRACSPAQLRRRRGQTTVEAPQKRRHDSQRSGRSAPWIMGLSGKWNRSSTVNGCSSTSAA